MVLSTLSGFLTLLLEARTPAAEMCMYMKPSAEMDGLLPVSRLGGASQVSHCSRCCLPRFQRDIFVGKRTREVCGRPVTCLGQHELPRLAAHLPGGAEACSQCSYSQCTHKIDQWPMQQEGSLYVLLIPTGLSDVLDCAG